MSNRDVFLIPFDVPREEAVHHIVNSLNALQANSEQLFRQATRRLDQSTSRVSSLHQRLDVLGRKVNALDETDEVPFLCSPSTYPKLGLGHSREAVFGEPSSMTPSCSKIQAGGFHMKSAPAHKRDVPARFTYVYERPRFSEIRLSSKKAVGQVGCELVPEEELYGAKRDTSTLKKQSTSADIRRKTPMTESLLAHCEFPDSTRQPLLLDGFDMLTTGDGHSMAADDDTFDLPTDLPLPGTSKFQSCRVKPTSSRSPIDFSTRNSFYLRKDEPAYASLLASRHGNANDSVSLTLDIPPTTSTKPNGPSSHSPKQPVQFTSPNNNTTKHAQYDSTLTSSSNRNEPVPSPRVTAPPPPPPPPPPTLQLSSPAGNGGAAATAGTQLDFNNGHSDLMDAIRRAGGTKGAKLKKVENSDEGESGKVVPDGASATKAPNSDDLMSSLAKALELRRKGVSGKRGKFAHVEKGKKAESGNQMDGALSRLREGLPVDVGKNGDASLTDDEWK